MDVPQSIWRYAMRFLMYREPLTERSDPAPIPNLRQLLIDARNEGKATAQSLHDRRTQPSEVLLKQSALHRRTHALYGFGSSEAELVLGIQGTLVGQHLLKHPVHRAVGYAVCADGQQRLTRALVQLAEGDRYVLFGTKDADLRHSFYGALAVARIATALARCGAQAFLPTVEDDSSHGIDLLVKAGNTGACVQVKAAKGHNLIEAVDDLSFRIVRGTALFNQKYSCAWRAINADVVLRRTGAQYLGGAAAKWAASRIIALTTP